MKINAFRSTCNDGKVLCNKININSFNTDNSCSHSWIDNPSRSLKNHGTWWWERVSYSVLFTLQLDNSITYFLAKRILRLHKFFFSSVHPFLPVFPIPMIICAPPSAPPCFPLCWLPASPDVYHMLLLISTPSRVGKPRPSSLLCSVSFFIVCRQERLQVLYSSSSVFLCSNSDYYFLDIFSL